jgi:vacuolar protein sorting-associated protein IST1
LIIQKNRREAIIRQERTDIGQLLHIGQLEQARARVALHISAAVVLSKWLVAVCGWVFTLFCFHFQIDKLYKDQCLLDAYDQIDYSCNCVAANIADIYKRKDMYLSLIHIF